MSLDINERIFTLKCEIKMKLRIFLYSLLSAISINCILTPNSEVSVLKGTGSIFVNDGVLTLEGEFYFETDSNLIEGITYNINNIIGLN